MIETVNEWPIKVRSSVFDLMSTTYFGSSLPSYNIGHSPLRSIAKTNFQTHPKTLLVFTKVFQEVPTNFEVGHHWFVSNCSPGARNCIFTSDANYHGEEPASIGKFDAVVFHSRDMDTSQKE